MKYQVKTKVKMAVKIALIVFWFYLLGWMAYDSLFTYPLHRTHFGYYSEEYSTMLICVSMTLANWALWNTWKLKARLKVLEARI